MLKKEANQIIRKIHQDYNTIAADWDKTRILPSGIKLKLLNDIKEGMKVLDLGCGNGLVALQILKTGALYFGTDISEKLIKISKNKFKVEVKKGEAKFFVADATKKLPFKSNYFDRIFCFAVLHHIPSDDLRVKLLSEVKRVLKNGGEAKFIVWNLMNEWPYKRFKIKEQLENSKVGFEEGDVFLPWKATENKIIDRYLYVFNADKIKKLVIKAGFKNIKVDYYNRAGLKEKNGEALVLRVKK